MDASDPTDPPSQARPDDERTAALGEELDDSRERVERIEERGADGAATPEPRRRFIQEGTEGTEYEDNAIAP